jgi:hypothetical protein
MSEYKYYDYLKKYTPKFLNSHESWAHWNWGRKSGFTDLLSYRAYTLMSPRNILFEGVKIKGWFFVFGSLFCIMDIWGIWYFQEIHQKYSTRKWVYYQPYMKPEMTFIEYSNLFK